MTGRPEVHVIRKAELLSGMERGWDDPEGLSRLTPQKRSALLENPLSHQDDDPVQLIGTKDRRVVGKMDLLVGQFDLGSEAVPTLWTSAYYVPEVFRTTLIGVMLILELQRLSPTVSACGVSQMALPVFQRLKWSDFPLHRHVMVLRSRPVVTRWLGANIGSTLVGGALDIPLRLQRSLWSSRADRGVRGLRCEGVEQMGADLDQQLRPSVGGGVSPHRSAAWINWLLEHRFSDDRSFRKSLYYVCDSDRVVGYFILKTRHYPSASHRGFQNVTLGSLGDWMVFDSSRLQLEQLLLLAVRELVSWQPDVIEMCLEPGTAGTWLQRWGFPHFGDLHILVGASSRSPLRDRRLRGQDAWRLRPAEGDNLFS